MNLLRIVVIALAALASVAGVLQELRHLGRVGRMDVRAAVLDYEKRRRVSDRNMVIVTAVLVVVGAFALIYHFKAGS